MKAHSILMSCRCAVLGIIYCLKTERNMRIHFVVAAVVIILSYLLGLSRSEFGLVVFAIGLVLTAEMFNSVVETVLDIVTEEYDPRIKVVKDVTAGAVLVAVITSAIIGVTVFFRFL